MKKSTAIAAPGKLEPTYIPHEQVASYSVHPLAANYVMLDDAKLHALAADIAKPAGGRPTGQIHPVILRRLDDTYEVVDGRNRLEACRRANVDVLVMVEELDEDAAIARIVSLNNQRRQLSHRQQAESAWAYYEARKGMPGPRLTQKAVADMFGISLRTFHKWKPDGVDAELADRKKGNNNNCFPIDFRYRRHAHMLSELMRRPLSKCINADEVLGLPAQIERLYRLEFQAE